MGLRSGEYGGRFFVRESKLAEKPPNGRRMRPNPGCGQKGRRQLQQRNIASLCDELFKKGAVRVQFAMAFGATLLSRIGVAPRSDRLGPTNTRRR